ncbi:MAG: toxin co-regulated pilus biosynthesis Q family protein [Alphaproteobacteria bacterium]|nr:toxin co-regulated pilus biosynthesis Q family protein [Alphaproteobacteria bacterium]
MGKKFNSFILKSVALTALFTSAVASAEDIYIDCTGQGASQERCAALYAEQAFLPTNAAGNNERIAQPNNIDINNPYAPINATPGMEGQQQIIMRDTAAPIAISQPMNELEEVGSEYSVYKTPTGSLIVERDVTQEQDDDGNTIQMARTKETTISPAYVEMPSISAAKLKTQVAYGDATHDWEALSGESLRSLLVEWGQKSGWTVVWKMDRDYILEAGVVFRGTFTEVASAIIRTFARANPAPIGTFYKGNRVLVINTQEDDNA